MESSSKVTVILSGCGVFDGSEIHESVCTLLALDLVGVSYECLAPNVKIKSESMNALIDRLVRAA